MKTPPAKPVRWLVARRLTPARVGWVEAQTWSAAREKAMAAFGLGPDEVLLMQANEGEGEPT